VVRGGEERTVILLTAALLASSPAPLDDVALKSHELTFTATHLLTLYQGQIWWKPRGPGPWELFPPRGMPVGEKAVWEPPHNVDQISADGLNLIAVGDDGRIYYSKLDTPKWTNVWGPTFKEGPLRIDLGGREEIAISHRKIPFEDIDGNPHPVLVGVTTLFITSHGGRTLEYTDPWLPPGKRHPLCLPNHGAFRAAAMSASASTVFVMDANGHSYTRLADFDVLGLDPFLRYGWDRRRRTSALDDETYSLPPAPWREQPPLPGPAMQEVTIFQTGPTNADRELRVGAPTGYWHKRIDGQLWEHADGPRSNAADGVTSRPIDNPVPAHVKTLHGDLDGTAVTLEDFAPDCPPAVLVVGDARLPLPFLEDYVPGQTKVLTGALYDDGHHLPLFHGRDFIEVRLELDGSDATLVEQFRPRALALKVELHP
jgi:hypothetical protein